MLSQLGGLPGVGPSLDFRAALGDRHLAFLPSGDLLREGESVLQRHGVGSFSLRQQLLDLVNNTQ